MLKSTLPLIFLLVGHAAQAEVTCEKEIRESILEFVSPNANIKAVTALNKDSALFSASGIAAPYQQDAENLIQRGSLNFSVNLEYADQSGRVIQLNLLAIRDADCKNIKDAASK